MKTKLLTAYEPESSITVRLTPEKIGTLLASTSNTDLEKVFSEFVENVNMLATTERVDSISKTLINTVHKLK